MPDLENSSEVFRKGNDVLISVSGFTFPVGKAEITPENFGLPNKIIQAFNKFPDSMVEVSGHTDATGSPEKNQKLSQERADNVAKFLNHYLMRHFLMRNRPMRFTSANPIVIACDIGLSCGR